MKSERVKGENTHSMQEEIVLLAPQSMMWLNRQQLMFGWRHDKRHYILPKGCHYRISIYKKPSTLGKKAPAVEKPVFQADIGKATIYFIKHSDVRMESGRVYSWQISMVDGLGKTLMSTAKQHFGYSTRSVVAITKASPTGSTGRSPGQFIAPDEPYTVAVETDSKYQSRKVPLRYCGKNAPEFFPPAPFVFGCPVEMRCREAAATRPVILTPPPDQEDELLTTMSALVWGTTAATVHLIPQLWEWCQLGWDYTERAGCEGVMLQIAGEDGFAYNVDSPDILSDPGVRAAYKGPTAPTYSCMSENDPGELVRVDEPADGSDDEQQHACFFNLRHEGIWRRSFEMPRWVYLRLIPLDSNDSPIDWASDPVEVFCHETWPEIQVEDESVEWIWGEVPRRVAEFTIRLDGDFPRDDPGISLPVSFVISTHKHPVRDVEVSVDELEVHSTTVISESTNWRTGEPYEWNAYVFQVDEWTNGKLFRCRWDQELDTDLVWGYPPPAVWDFIDFEIGVKAFPGIAKDWPYRNGGSLTNETCKLPEFINCEQSIFDAFRIKRTDELRNYFRSKFTGTRRQVLYKRVRENDSWREEEELGYIEEDVTVDFSFYDIEDENFLLEFSASYTPDDEPAPTMGETLTNRSSSHGFSLYNSDELTLDGQELRLLTDVDGFPRDLVDAAAEEREYTIYLQGAGVRLKEDFGSRKTYAGEVVHQSGRIILGLPDTMEMNFGMFNHTKYFRCPEYTCSIEYIVRREYHLTRES